MESFGQCDKDLNIYKHYSIYEKNDTINFHVYAQGNLDTVSNILLYLHGSGAFPLFRIRREGQSLWMNSSVPISPKPVRGSAFEVDTIL